MQERQAEFFQIQGQLAPRGSGFRPFEHAHAGLPRAPGEFAAGRRGQYREQAARLHPPHERQQLGFAAAPARIGMQMGHAQIHGVRPLPAKEIVCGGKSSKAHAMETSAATPGIST